MTKRMSMVGCLCFAVMKKGSVSCHSQYRAVCLSQNNPCTMLNHAAEASVTKCVASHQGLKDSGSRRTVVRGPHEVNPRGDQEIFLVETAYSSHRHVDQRVGPKALDSISQCILYPATSRKARTYAAGTCTSSACDACRQLRLW